MSLGNIFFLAAAILLFLAGIGSTLLPNAHIWALFCVALGLFLHGYDFRLRPR